MTPARRTRPFVCSVEDREGDQCVFVGEYDWFWGSDGPEIEDIRYWPINEELRESVYDWVYEDFKDIPKV